MSEFYQWDGWLAVGTISGVAYTILTYVAQNHFETHQLPAKLVQGDHYEKHILIERIEEAVTRAGYSGTVKLTIVFTDSVGREYKAKQKLLKTPRAY